LSLIVDDQGVRWKLVLDGHDSILFQALLPYCALQYLTTDASLWVKVPTAEKLLYLKGVSADFLPIHNIVANQLPIKTTENRSGGFRLSDSRKVSNTMTYAKNKIKPE
jgi:hypothetical protein